jgi:uncharacterized membrane protein
MSHRPVFAVYLALVILQVLWHFVLPTPMGARNWILASVAIAPLLLPIAGIFSGRFRSMTWGGFLAVLYFCIGVMEAWSNPPQRVPAIAQITLALLYCLLLAYYSRNNDRK